MGLRLRPGVPRREALNALSQYAFRELGCIHFEFADRNYTREDVNGLGFRTHFDGDSFVDLTPDENQIFHNMNRSARRYCNRRGPRCGLVVEEARKEDFADEFFAQLQDVFSKQGLVPTHGKERVRLLIRHLMPTGRLLLLRTRDSDGHCIATGISIGAGDRSHFWGNASWQSCHALRPNEPLHWQAMMHWKARGAAVYEMGGADYVQKYGAVPCQQMRLRKSKYAWIRYARSFAATGFRFYQKVAGMGARNFPSEDADAQ
jgi:hypothetical protein